MEKSILQIIQNKIPELTEAQRKVADYIMKNSMDTAFLTVDQLAGVVGTSTTTVMRLAFNLGFSGYAEFQKELQGLLRTRVDPQARLQANLQDINKSDLWIRCAEKQIHNIQSTVELVQNDTLQKAIGWIHDARQIYCLGSRSSKPVAEFLNHGLNRLLGNSQLAIYDVWPEKVSAFSSSDVVIGVSFPRYSRRVINMTKMAKENNARIISITDGYSSPLASFTDLLLPSSYHSLAFHNSIIGAMFIADYLISAIAINYPEDTKKRLDKNEQTLTDLNYHYMD